MDSRTTRQLARLASDTCEPARPRTSATPPRFVIAVVVVVTVIGAIAVLQRSGPDSTLVGRGGDVAYATGACRAFAPTGRANGWTVFLSPGHGGVDPGGVPRSGAASGTEKELADGITQRTLPLLREAGFRVVVSRVGDSSVVRMRPDDVRGGALTVEAKRRDLAARVSCANAAHADVLVSVHLNSSGSSSASGAQTLYNPNRSFSARSRALASALHRSIVASMQRSGRPVRDRGVTTDGSAGGRAVTAEAQAYGQLMELGPAAPPWFTSPSLMPGAVIEPLFVTNPDEARYVMSDAGRQAIARGVLNGLQTYFASSR